MLQGQDELIQRGDHVLIANLFGDEFIYAETGGFAHIAGFVGRSQDDDGEFLQSGLFPQPFEEVHAIHPRHFEIGQNDVRQGCFRVFQGGEIVLCLQAVAQMNQGASEACFVQRPLEKKKVVRIIFDQNNAEGLLRYWHAVEEVRMILLDPGIAFDNRRMEEIGDGLGEGRERDRLGNVPVDAQARALRQVLRVVR
jgi:hypothetical protein